MSTDYETLTFNTQAGFRDWLGLHCTDTDGIWLRLYKKNSGVASIDHAQALDEALCYGWIDGQAKKYDEQSYLQKFTPRRPKSLWSKRNVDRVGALTQQGLMAPSGFEAVAKAKQDGRWDAAYDRPSDMTVPDEFLAELAKRPKAKEFFESLNKTNTYAIAWRLRTAKTDKTRLNRQAKLLEMLEAGEKFH